MFSLMTFTITFTVLLWRDGYFNSWFVARGAVVDSGSRRWMLGDKRRYREAVHSVPSTSPRQNPKIVTDEPTPDQPDDVVRVGPI